MLLAEAGNGQFVLEVQLDLSPRFNHQNRGGVAGSLFCCPVGVEQRRVPEVWVFVGRVEVLEEGVAVKPRLHLLAAGVVQPQLRWSLVVETIDRIPVVVVFAAIGVPIRVVCGGMFCARTFVANLQ